MTAKQAAFTYGIQLEEYNNVLDSMHVSKGKLIMDLSLLVRGATLNKRTVGFGVYSQLFERSVSHL